MKEFLANIRPPKYLRYLFFILYSWYRKYKSEREGAHGTAIIFLWGIHGFLILSILFVISPKFVFESGKNQIVIPLLFLSGISFYFLFWYQNKWQFFIEEFNHIKRKKQRIGLIYLFIYLFTILAFFVFSLYVIIQKSPYYN